MDLDFLATVAGAKPAPLTPEAKVVKATSRMRDLVADARGDVPVGPPSHAVLLPSAAEQHKAALTTAEAALQRMVLDLRQNTNLSEAEREDIALKARSAMASVARDAVVDELAGRWKSVRNKTNELRHSPPGKRLPQLMPIVELLDKPSSAYMEGATLINDVAYGIRDTLNNNSISHSELVRICSCQWPSPSPSHA